MGAGSSNTTPGQTGLCLLSHLPLLLVVDGPHLPGSIAHFQIRDALFLGSLRIDRPLKFGDLCPQPFVLLPEGLRLRGGSRRRNRPKGGSRSRYYGFEPMMSSCRLLPLLIDRKMAPKMQTQTGFRPPFTTIPSWLESLTGTLPSGITARFPAELKPKTPIPEETSNSRSTKHGTQRHIVHRPMGRPHP